MNEELETLRVVTQGLEEATIPYMISGSMAANYYSIPRMTRDIDIVIELKISSLGKFSRIFKKEFLVDEEMVESEVQKNGMFNLIHREFLIKIDFILRKPSSFQDSTFQRRKKVTIENTPMWFISAEDLILSKLLWAKDSHSQIQLNDVRNLLETTEDPLDQKYLQTWISHLKLEDIYREV